MRASISVEVEHLGGPSCCRIESELEPNESAWNSLTFVTMARAMNQLLAAVMDERDRRRFEQGEPELRGETNEELLAAAAAAALNGGS